MKKNLPTYYFFYGLLFKISLCVALILSTSAYAQSKDKLYSFKWKNTTILDAFKQIESQGQVHFSYNPLDLNVNARFDLNIEKQKINDVLDAISKKVSIKYQINGQTIMIQSYKPVVVKVEFTITGTVTDEKNIPIPGVSVINATANKTVSTNESGKFSIAANKGDIIRFRMMGFQQTGIVASESQKNITVVLKEESLELKETVVTALGIKREERSLGYAVSEVNGEGLKKSKRNKRN